MIRTLESIVVTGGRFLSSRFNIRLLFHDQRRKEDRHLEENQNQKYYFSSEVAKDN
jgi:hypothetical protein